MSQAPPRLFALDQGFPQNILAALRASIREAELVWIGDIDPALCDADDWEVLAALRSDERPWDGLITTDDGMLKLPKEMAILCQTRLTLVVAESAGHDPPAATGLLLAHLPYICKETVPDRPQLWRLRARQKRWEEPWEYLKDWAVRNHESPKAVYDRLKLAGHDGKGR